MSNPFLVNLPRIARLEQRLAALNDQVASVRYAINAIIGQATHNNIVASGASGAVTMPPGGDDGGGDGILLAKEGDREKDRVFAVPPGADATFVKPTTNPVNPDENPHFYLANVLIPGINRLAINASAHFYDLNDAAPMHIIYKTINLGDGPKLYAVPVGAWC